MLPIVAKHCTCVLVGDVSPTSLDKKIFGKKALGKCGHWQIRALAKRAYWQNTALAKNLWQYRFWQKWSLAKITFGSNGLAKLGGNRCIDILQAVTP